MRTAVPPHPYFSHPSVFWELGRSVVSSVLDEIVDHYPDIDDQERARVNHEALRPQGKKLVVGVKWISFYLEDKYFLI